MSKIAQNPIIISTFYFILLFFVFLMQFTDFHRDFTVLLLFFNNDYLFTKYVLCILPSFLLLSKKIDFKFSSSVIFSLYFFVYFPIILFFFNETSVLFQLKGIKYAIPSNKFDYRDILLIQIILCIIFCIFFYYLKHKTVKKEIFLTKIKSQNFFIFLNLIFIIFFFIILYSIINIIFVSFYYYIEKVNFIQLSFVFIC